MAHRISARIAAAGIGLVLLAGCEEGTGLSLFEGGNVSSEDATNQTTLVEREVEAPEVFQATENGLWDGRPSFGGVWVTFPDVKSPEQVIIRNEANGKFVIGALFDRERDNPGPRLTVSSDAASALGMLAGQPTPLNVTALRKEQVPVAPPVTDAPPAEAAPVDEVSTETLDDPIEAAAAAIDRAEEQVGDIAPADAPAAPAVAPAALPKSALDKPFIQIGIFSVEANANRTSDNLRKAGVVPTVKKGEVKGKPFWRVIVGPAGTKADRDALLEKARGLGFADAYFVTN
ncbi:hypothetical protein ACMU_09075 [Actibacterium mucosum KCTC 23349]|uniref:SPOR domain-containing protein n=1 Tax=Actibacterium mucosum KCTC 23349 TaxID=1454373 RepID=A0A037ZJY1_9RHOB|nr:SPOR domain-containing protein [Actibacterium mucosum]KAJ55909.1 hypothetical protein ACMU_09075 [Actibacterium mucosum KCTC 23349]